MVTTEEYFFYEWMIVEMGITAERFAVMSEEDIEDLKLEWIGFVKLAYNK